MRKNILLTLAISVIMITGCSKKVPEIDNTIIDTPAVQPSTVGTGVDSAIDKMSGMDSSVVSYASEDERLSAIENELAAVYFGTDRYDISVTESEKVDMDANILNGAMASDLAVNIEGNCDEWGTDEYNFALGLKRAKTVKNTLVNNGIKSSDIIVVSLGESNPVCNDQTASCWKKNRRVDHKLLP